MAELILTDEEKAAISWLDMSDDALGKVVRHGCLALPKLMGKDVTGAWKLWVTTAGLMMCNLAADANSEKTTFTFEGVTFEDKPRGNWQIVIKRTKAPSPNAPCGAST